MTDTPIDISITGGGSTAKAAALALSHVGFSVRLADEETMTPAPSVLALAPAACAMLERLDVKIPPAAPVAAMRIWRDRPPPDATGDGDAALAIDPPTDDAPLAHIVETAALASALREAVAAQPRIVSAPATPSAALTIDTSAGDGASLRHDYKHAALVAHVRGSAPHANIARQIFLPSGPLGLLPTMGDDFALIWSLPTARAQALARCDDDIFTHELTAATNGRWGALAATTARITLPLSLRLAENVTANRRVLLGATAIHPLAGQGFNLALRDAATLAEVLDDAAHLGRDIGQADVLDAYQNARRPDNALTAAFTHALFATQGRGLAAGGALLRRIARAADLARAQADHGLNHAPRLMERA